MSQTEIKEENNKTRNIEETKNKSTISKKKLINILDFENNPTPQNRINSPRSLQSIANLGYLFEDLIFYDFNQFKQNHLELMPLNPEIQQKRYNFYENQRQKRMENLKETYKTLCKTENKNTIKNNNSQNTLVNNFLSNDFESTAIKNNLKSFERMKAKSELDLINMVQYEIQREMIQQDAKEKLKMQNEKRELFQQELQKKRNEENMKKLQKEKEKREKEEEDYKIQQAKNK